MRVHTVIVERAKYECLAALIISGILRENSPLYQTGDFLEFLTPVNPGETGSKSPVYRRISFVEPDDASDLVILSLAVPTDMEQNNIDMVVNVNSVASDHATEATATPPAAPAATPPQPADDTQPDGIISDPPAGLITVATRTA